MNRQILSSIAFLVLGASFWRECQAKSDTNQQVRNQVTGERACSSENRRITADKDFAALLSDYGIDSLPNRTCRAVDIPWLKSAQIVQFSGVQHTDVLVSLTFIRLDQNSQLWLVPVNGGLSKHVDAEDDPHNKAVLNLLLRSARYKPDADQMVDLARLYMFLMGHRESPALVGSNQLHKANTKSAEVVKEEELVTVTLHRVTDQLMRGGPEDWVLEFERREDGVRLLSVNPERL